MSVEQAARAVESWKWTPAEFRSLWPEFDAQSWASWASIEDAIFGLRPTDPELVRRVSGFRDLPTSPVSEFWAAVGRGGGKSRFVARLAVYFSVGREYKRVPGENIFVGVFAPDRKQAKVTLRYIAGLLKAVPALENMIVSEKQESVELANGVVIEVLTASKAAPRGRAYALAIIEEAAFLPVGDSADPDRELVRALRPALARVPASLLCVVSSPYARRGELYRTWRKHYGKDSDGVLVIQAPTLSLNPGFDRREIERAYADDRASALAEYGGEFRSDVQTFVSQEALELCVIPDRRELPPVDSVGYVAFVDPSGGGADSFTLAIGHLQRGLSTDGDTGTQESVAIVDCVREMRPPFSPEAVVTELVGVLKSYHVRSVTGDRYAGEWPREAFRRHGIEYELAEKPKSDMYRDVLALINSGRVELLDNERLLAQLGSLERRTARGGRDSIDHPPGGHDDVANVVAGLACKLALNWSRPCTQWGRLGARTRVPSGPGIVSRL